MEKHQFVGDLFKEKPKSEHKIEVEAENGELVLRNSNGDVSIIPAKYKLEVQDMIKNGCHKCIDDLVSKLPKSPDKAPTGGIYESDFTTISRDEEERPVLNRTYLPQEFTPNYEKLATVPAWPTLLKQSKDHENVVIGDYTGIGGNFKNKPFTFSEARKFPEEIKKKYGIDVMEKYFNDLKK
jgi:hypothetical protein